MSCNVTVTFIGKYTSSRALSSLLHNRLPYHISTQPSHPNPPILTIAAINPPPAPTHHDNVFLPVRHPGEPSFSTSSTKPAKHFV